MGQRKKLNSDVGPTKTWSTCGRGLEQALSIRVVIFGAGTAFIPQPLLPFSLHSPGKVPASGETALCS